MPKWVTLLGLVLLMGVATLAFVDYEMTRADAQAAGLEAARARASCVYLGPAFTLVERKRRREQCEQLPGPIREADRVERRWDRRSPWYGFAAAAVFLPTAAMFVQSRRRRGTAATSDRWLTRRWRHATIAVRLAVGLTIWAALVYLVVDRWERLVEESGGSTHDCHYPENDCGALGEFTEAHPVILLTLIIAAAAIPAALVVWSMSRLFRSLEDQPFNDQPGPRAPGPAVAK